MRVLAVIGVVLGLACSSPGAAPIVESVVPARADTRADTALVIHGQHLEPRVTLDLDRPSRSIIDQTFVATLRGPAELRLTGLRWVNASRLEGVLPRGAKPGRYDLTVTDPGGMEAVLERAVEVVGLYLLPDGGSPDGGPVPCTTSTWADEDLDGYGAGTPALLCGPSRVRNDLDCNDADPMTSPQGRELCNGVDDDCDGLTDEGVCPADAGWTVQRNTGSLSSTWATASSGARGRLIVAGKAQALVRQAGVFSMAAIGTCPSNLVSSWQSSGGQSFVGGGASGTGTGQGRASEVSQPSPACGDVKMVSDPVVGMVGFPRDGGLELFGALRSGDLARWSPGQPVVEVPGKVPGNTRLEDLHGLDPDTLYAVGAKNDDGDHMRVFRWSADGWVDQHLSDLSGSQKGALHGLWVLGPDTVVVGGDDGLVALLQGQRWTKLGSIDGGVRSVRAFGPSRVYAATTSGQVLRWNGTRWDVVYDNRAQLPLFDLAGTAEDDLWVVGGQGLVAHWPD